jgi:hypothetical protein
VRLLVTGETRSKGGGKRANLDGSSVGSELGIEGGLVVNEG